MDVGRSIAFSIGVISIIICRPSYNDAYYDIGCKTKTGTIYLSVTVQSAHTYISLSGCGINYSNNFGSGWGENGDHSTTLKCSY